MEKKLEQLIGNTAHVVRAAMLTFCRDHHAMPERIIFNPPTLKIFLDSLQWPERQHFKVHGSPFGMEWDFYGVLLKCVPSDQPPYLVGPDGTVEYL